ncbi:antichymotrypsin-2-like isoform X2 [Atheta coriaria]|uniref:antichymotrypsin-2-like isoform X2 n=1 Tax=Dalotia coriaria TaxID=877792 RepID=UPI0031F46BC8
MMKLMVIVVLVAISSQMSSALPSGTHEEDDYDFGESNRAFAAAVYKELSKSEPSNFLTCPLSVQTVMALTSLGAKGDTATEITRGLKLPSNQKLLKTIFRHLMPQLRGNEFYSLTSANKLFVNHNFKLKQAYQDVARYIFDADVDTVDFSLNYEAARDINDWVQDKTNNKIQEIISPEDLLKETKLVLANALHFKGKWQYPFDPVDTIKRPFYSEHKEPHNVDMMQLTDFFNYYENEELDAKFLELPYQGHDVSMVFVLPNKVDGLKRLEHRMEEVLQDQPFKKQHVRIQIPKFSMETTIKYKKILQDLGIDKVFTEHADLSDITPDNNLQVNTVIQKTFINVTETGTEAAAATASGVITLSIPPADRVAKLHFVADHPFLMCVLLRQQAEHPRSVKMPLFVGRFSAPSTF